MGGLTKTNSRKFFVMANFQKKPFEIKVEYSANHIRYGDYSTYNFLNSKGLHVTNDRQLHNYKITVTTFQRVVA